MDSVYVKAALYMYGGIPGRVKEIDNIIYRKALASMGDYRPALEIADDIVNLKIIKSYLIDLHREISTMLTTLKPYYLDCIYYKYFRHLQHTYSETFDPTNRNYFRRQQRLVSEVESKLVVVGFDDEWFTSNRNDPFIGAAIDRAIYIEEANKNNTKKKKRKERYMKRFLEDTFSIGIVVTIIFLLLQACEFINWSVLWLLAPLWMPIAVTIALGIIVFIFSALAAMVALSIERRRLKKDK